MGEWAGAGRGPGRSSAPAIGPPRAPWWRPPQRTNGVRAAVPPTAQSSLASGAVNIATAASASPSPGRFSRSSHRPVSIALHPVSIVSGIQRCRPNVFQPHIPQLSQVKCAIASELSEISELSEMLLH